MLAHASGLILLAGAILAIHIRPLPCTIKAAVGESLFSALSKRKITLYTAAPCSRAHGYRKSKWDSVCEGAGQMEAILTLQADTASSTARATYLSIVDY